MIQEPNKSIRIISISPIEMRKITGEEGTRMKSNINDGIISAIMLAVTTAAGTAASYGIKKMVEAIASKKGGK